VGFSMVLLWAVTCSTGPMDALASIAALGGMVLGVTYNSRPSEPPERQPHQSSPTTLNQQENLTSASSTQGQPVPSKREEAFDIDNDGLTEGEEMHVVRSLIDRLEEIARPQALRCLEEIVQSGSLAEVVELFREALVDQITASRPQPGDTSCLVYLSTLRRYQICHIRKGATRDEAKAQILRALGWDSPPSDYHLIDSYEKENGQEAFLGERVWVNIGTSGRRELGPINDRHAIRGYGRDWRS
jgi:hypothetical protein